MKKRVLIFGIIFIALLMLGGCNRDKDYYDENGFSKGVYYYEISNAETKEIVGYGVLKYEGAGKDVRLSPNVNGKPLLKIADKAFANLDITSINIPKNMLAIGQEAFSGCTKLNGVIFNTGSQLDTIGDKAFFGCTSLSKIVIPTTVKEIGFAVFGLCDNLKMLSIPFVGTSDSTTAINEKAVFGYMFGQEASAGTIRVEQTYASGSSYVAEIPKALEEVVVTNTTRLNQAAFHNCEMIVTLRLPKTLLAINEYAVEGCKNLNKVFYEGTEEMWSNICIINRNNDLLSTVSIVYSEEKAN